MPQKIKNLDTASEKISYFDEKKIRSELVPMAKKAAENLKVSFEKYNKEKRKVFVNCPDIKKEDLVINN